MNKLNLDDVKKIELQILISFRDFCDNNNLKYMLGYGTLLGCKRHKGFIPWDDDIDVYMFREDYEKLISLKNEFNDKYKNLFIKTRGTENYPFPFIKITDETTVVLENGIQEKYKYGIWIDIFPLDYVPENKNKFVRCVNTINICNKILVKSMIKKGFIGNNKIIKLINNYCFIPISVFLSRLINIPNYCEKKILKVANKKTSQIACYIWEADFNIFELNDILPLKKDYFENHLFSVPQNIEKYLTIQYGNYMELPPVEDRITHLVSAWRKEGKNE